MDTAAVALASLKVAAVANLKAATPVAAMLAPAMLVKAACREAPELAETTLAETVLPAWAAIRARPAQVAKRAARTPQLQPSPRIALRSVVLNLA